ncbi:pyridoxamine 5'-phosphate oxidase family protein [Sphingomonas jatrophae]|uniref:General stress protein 26 n=1 Tax=Sphingomonas jatrophae TaxID=1166337 RepID=A0A1I6LRH4_9SPHN|nr:pyridoxamine 5'-phosphate oxidase family protein [Sphingomonas jatrophae]SFS05900.1 General stress protein 26 [Sphingomonas jatrophae]
MAKTLPELAKAMRSIDFAMLATHSRNGTIAMRPMSNNRDVDYDGDSYFFTDAATLTVEDIEHNPQVSLSYLGSSGLLGQRPFFVAVEGKATLIRDRGAFSAHWTSDLDRWFPQGIDTPSLVLIHVRASRIHYWDGEKEGELLV